MEANTNRVSEIAAARDLIINDSVLMADAKALEELEKGDQAFLDRNGNQMDPGVWITERKEFLESQKAEAKMNPADAMIIHAEGWQTGEGAK